MQERDNSIDVAKGILMICVIYGHVFTEGVIHDFIYTFHMPAFFVISGMLLAKTNTIHSRLPKTILKKLRTIIIPLVFFEALGAISYTLIFGRNQNIIGFIYNAVHLEFNNGVDWFLFTLFCAEMIFIIIYKCTSKNYLRLIVSAMIFAVLLMLPLGEHYSKAMGRIALALILLNIGYQCMPILRKKNMVLCICAFFATAIVAFFNGHIEMAWMMLNNPVLFAIGAVAGTVFILNLGRYITKGRINTVLTFFGKNSLTIMGTHAVLADIARRQIVDVNNQWQLLATLIVIIILEHPIVLLINNYAPFLIGKTKPKKLEAKI